MNINYLLEIEIKDTILAQDAIKYKDFERATFINCDFTCCDFQAVAFIDCIFTNCNFNEAKINYVSLRNVVFNNCDFIDVNFAMVDKFLFEVGFNDCKLDYSKFYTLKLKATTFNNCSLIATDFMKTDLTEVVFNNCNLHKSVFIDTISNKANFKTSYNYTIDPSKNKLKKAVFSLEGLKGLLYKHDIIVE
jgi:uncharacterized protein YjbI with pentapeptide repeats